MRSHAPARSIGLDGLDGLDRKCKRKFSVSGQPCGNVCEISCGLHDRNPTHDPHPMVSSGTVEGKEMGEEFSPSLRFEEESVHVIRLLDYESNGVKP